MTCNKGQKIDISARVPQGAVLGPTLWNILYDGVLRMPSMGEATSIAYADDLARVVAVENRNTLITCTNECLYRINGWMTNHTAKTESLLLKEKRGREGISFSLCNEEIILSRLVKYPGIYLEEGGILTKKNTCAKLLKRQEQLS